MPPRKKQPFESSARQTVAGAIGLLCLLGMQQVAFGIPCSGTVVVENDELVCKLPEPPKLTGLDLDVLYGGSIQFNQGIGALIDVRPHRFVQLEAVAFYGKGSDVHTWTDSGKVFLRVPFLDWVGHGFNNHLVHETLSIEAGSHWGTLPFGKSSDLGYLLPLDHVFYPSLGLRFDWYDKMTENPVGTRMWTVALRGHRGPFGTPAPAPGTDLYWKGSPGDNNGTAPYPGARYGFSLYARVTLLYYVTVAVELGGGAVPQSQAPFAFWGGYWIGASFPLL